MPEPEVVDLEELLGLVSGWMVEVRGSAPGLVAAVAAARTAFERSHLLIAGGEAAGKSTLVNALLGVDVSPVSRYLPGTVAPLHVRYGRHRAPWYRVVLAGPDGADGEVIDGVAGREEFDRYLLQEHNEDNRLGVLRGEVLIDHPLLRDGVHLVDLPGALGVSPVVAEATRRYLTGSGCTLVLVIPGRAGMSTAAQVLQEARAGHTGMRLATVVVNETNPAWVQPDKVAVEVERRGQAMRQLLPLDGEDPAVFVLHLLSLAPGGDTRAADQRVAWQALVGHVSEHARRNGRVAAAGAAAALLRELDAALGERAALFADLRAGRLAVEQREALHRRAFGAATDGLSSALRAAEESSRAAAWKPVAAVVQAQAQRVRGVVDDRESLVSRRDTLPKQRAREIDQEINAALTAAKDAVEEAVAASFAAYAAVLSPVQQGAVAHYDAVFPVSGAGVSAVPVSPVSADAGKYRFENLGDGWVQLFDQGLWGPLLALLPTTWISVPLVHVATGGNRGETLRLLRTLRGAVNSGLDAQETGDLYARWVAVRQQTAQETADGVTALLRDAAGQLPDGLRGRAESIGQARSEISGWLARLGEAG
ncbi:energy-coupling factor transporter ATP-binding protein EcfA2 [Actinoplanes lutulentus]|uniref:Dynamin family protein n=1 Tax=Actinoplanes lutulentus TaxID=1287878 RepID=A0A327Z4Z2_9ACTN|nr:dynamin family protein [Actinoplanes lutulentus]MBB2948204.1 energy-coupling factor transporter ATP-binding protein EcfA2 [Actinoplanes lutulentus]RAK31296.1 dynamin family protein [Actinoplanes lutulentus]